MAADQHQEQVPGVQGLGQVQGESAMVPLLHPPDLPCIMTRLSKTMFLRVAWDCPACRSLAGTLQMPEFLRLIDVRLLTLCCAAWATHLPCAPHVFVLSPC